MGIFCIIPLFLFCCDWWKKCVYPAFSISVSTYMKLDKIFKAPNIKNLTLMNEAIWYLDDNVVEVVKYEGMVG